MNTTTRIVADSAFGCAGQRCLAASLAITVGQARETFTEAIAQAASDRVVGYGLHADVQMGPVITLDSRNRIENLIGRAADEGAEILVAGRRTRITGYEGGYFVRPTILQNLPPTGEIAKTEIFGPVSGLIHIASLDEAITLINSGRYGNMAWSVHDRWRRCPEIPVRSRGGEHRNQRGYRRTDGLFPVQRMEESFFGDLHGQGLDAVEFPEAIASI